MTKHHYVVTIPYYHQFTVVAESPEEAIEGAHSEEGRIREYDDSLAEVVMVDDILGTPDQVA